MSTKRMRLDAFLSRAGCGTRSEVKRAVRGGNVLVNGEVMKQPATIILADSTVQWYETVAELPPDRVDLIVHKPVGLSCSHDEREAPLLEEVYPEKFAFLGLAPAGRLDRATSGLLICSTDGPFLHRLIHPKQKVPKRYRVEYSGALFKKAVQRFADGLVLPDDEKPCLPAELTIEHADASGGSATIILHEGRFHQVRRMIKTVGGEVQKLHRDRIGSLDLPSDLAAGETRELTEAERDLLFASRRRGIAAKNHKRHKSPSGTQKDTKSHMRP